MRNHALLCRASLIASVLVSLSAAPAFAQASAAPEATADEDAPIVVTARRREESLLNVPIAITAISGDQLANQGSADITALAETVPNVTLEATRASNSTLSAFIRGVGQQDPVSGFEQGVGIYLDDVYLNRPQAAVLDIYDVQRIEVLRGPQGTLYGRNTVGGAVKYVTKRLDDVAHLSARATYGSYNQADGVVTGSVAVGDSKVIRLGGSLARLTRDGFGTNLTTGLSNYNKDIWAGRGTIELHGTDVFARITADYTHDTSNPRGGHRFIPGIISGTPVLANVYDTKGGLNFPVQDVTAWGTSLFLEATPTEGLTFRSITAYRKDDSATPIDFDALPAVDVDVPGYYRNHQLSQEVQMLVNKGKFNGLIGAYYLSAYSLTQFDVRLFTTVNGLTGYTDANVDTETMAAFADFTYDFSDQLSLSLGGRYTWDERSARILRQNYLGGGSPTFGGAGIAFGAPGTNFRGKQTFTKFTPRASLSFKPNPDTQMYVSFSQGFKGGGFDPRGAGANAPDLNNDGIKSDAEIAQFLSFRPEKVNSYEIGYKAALFDRRFTVALAAFRMDYTDIQIPGSVACTIGGLPSFCGVVSNAGKARMQGFEAEGKLRLGALTLNGSLGYIDAKYLSYITNIGGVPTEVSQFRHVQNTPAWSGAASATYGVDLGEGRVDLTAGMSFKSKTYQFEIANPYLDQPAYQLVDASIVYHAPGNRWSLGVFGKNLTDERIKTSGYTFMAFKTTGIPTGSPNGVVTGELAQPLASALGKEGVLSAFYANPRQVFVTATVSF